MLSELLNEWTSGSGLGDSHPDPVVEKHVTSRRENVFLRSSEEQSSAGQRRGSEKGIMGRNRYYELEDQGRIRAWSDLEAQVECGCAEPEHKDFRKRKKHKKRYSATCLLLKLWFIIMNTY